jgi:hypothetical protein
MANGEITLIRVFGYQEGTAQLKSKALEGAAAVSALKRALEKEAAEIKWPVALGEVMKQAGSLLNVPLGSVISAAWNKYRVLMKYSDPAKYSPDETFLVPLAEHTITSKHRPHIDVLIGDRRIGRIDFVIDISLTIKGFIAKVQGGRLREIKVGTCRAKGTIACEDFLLLEKESDSLDLPGSIDLGEGVPISPKAPTPERG